MGKKANDGQNEQRPTHSEIGASSMHRWARCPGSVKLSRGEPNTAGRAAEIGTMAHSYLEFILEECFSKNKHYNDVIGEFNSNVVKYLQYVHDLKSKGFNIHLEHKFDMTSIYQNLYGTADCVAYDSSNKTLHVIDYKHGEGIVVEVLNNLQLSYYALGALTTLPYNCRDVVMTIVQPRAHHPEGAIRSWRVPVTYFIDFEYELLKAVKATEKKSAPLIAGTHCQFCPAKKKCKQFKNEKTSNDKKQFGFYRDPAKDFDKVEHDKPNGQDTTNLFD